MSENNPLLKPEKTQGEQAKPEQVKPVTKATKVEQPKAEPVKCDDESVDVNGDMQAIDPKYAEPEGVKHTDQYTTVFPNEKAPRQ